MSKPFLKWAGGKTQMLTHIREYIPTELNSDINTYVEPFVGGGAVLFWILRNFSDVKNVIINDINTDLTTTYIIIRDNANELISQLKILQKKYFTFSLDERKNYYLEIRQKFNERNNNPVIQSAYFIFLNKTCYNGLYRVNKKNEFNVPFGKYKNPKICDEKTLLTNSQNLKNVIILNDDFEKTFNYIEGKSFFYFDPPYRPLNQTSSFNTYTTDGFDDMSQTRLSGFCDNLHDENHLWLLSNSDPKNYNPDDNFFDELYSKYSIVRVNAKRSINSDGSKRGNIKELLIRNYS